MFIKKNATIIFMLSIALATATPAEAKKLCGKSDSIRGEIVRTVQHAITAGTGAFIMGAPPLSEAFPSECTGTAIKSGAHARDTGRNPNPKAGQIVPGLLIEAFCQTPTGRFRLDIQYHVGSVCHIVQHGHTEYVLVAP